MRSWLWKDLHFDWETTTLTVVSTLLLIVDAYHRLTPWKYIDRTILYLFIPLLITVMFFRESPASYGFRLGDWRAGLTLTAAAILLMTPILWLLGRRVINIQDYYQGQIGGLPWTTFLDLVGWEFFFRGWLLFGYARKFGAQALWLQAVPFALAHISKPEFETLSTIFGGFAFGWVAWRTRSFLYPFLIHWFIATFVILVSAGALG
jgi:membrane protease YdiL (CAAX protease family)